ncbi:Crp/Fnr family transcriptional regulator [Flavobacterium sp. NKUCC04_CG]|uniref:Crp/Fnr family transcriptional regulator n=1 Tax=Flavobacterium sp. NKUCC04_CG TaxID=2842121 RepID=UPI001C5AAD52|nr:Crp/Fnr family transcriptional regulator [Flavobacterium sp. NKUCC04_CG]MBW3519146.1 Crp/Fnr family transcriptional regulator [Flavobacterium sp. NKUCC04_CG]
MIDVATLIQSGAEQKNYPKGTVIFEAKTYPKFYYQIVVGKVKMNNYSESGKEFIQNIFTAGQSFGEPPLFIDEPYPANAIALTAISLLQISKEQFFVMLYQHPEVSIAVNRSLARRLFFKAVMAPEISAKEPEKKLLALMDYIKNHSENPLDDTPFLIPMTRQQLADLTGLRVETVIRTIKQLEKEGKLQIIQRKIYR